MSTSRLQNNEDLHTEGFYTYGESSRKTAPAHSPYISAVPRSSSSKRRYLDGGTGGDHISRNGVGRNHVSMIEQPRLVEVSVKQDTINHQDL
jgi:hypothetical protein